MEHIQYLKHAVKRFTRYHRPDGLPNVFLMATPRGGSTWLMEMICSQPGFTFCTEPLNVRQPMVRRHLGCETWEEVYSRQAERDLHDYFKAFCEGRKAFLGPAPLRRHYRPFTHRMVFKVIHGAEDHVDWLCEQFNGRAVLLLRHPLAVSLSRQVYPRLRAFLQSDYRQHFTSAQIAEAQRFLKGGSDLQKGVLSWCLQNAVLLRKSSDRWPVLTYEQLVLNPRPVLEMTAARLDLPAPTRMAEHLRRPSSTTSKSDRTTQQYLEHTAEKQRQWLVKKWREQVTRREEREAMRVLDIFRMDAYSFGNVLPRNDLWIGDRATPTT